MSRLPSPPPAPSHLLRSHTSAVTALYISDDNERIYSADASGIVVITSTHTIRAITSFTAHSSSVLGVQEWAKNVVTHGRDNKLCFWTRIDLVDDPPICVGSSTALPEILSSTPSLLFILDVNALNYCRFSLSPLDYSKGNALVAVPNLVESALVDVWEMPSKSRIHAAVGKIDLGTRERGTNATGILMALHLFCVPSASSTSSNLHVLTAHENGSVALRRFSASQSKLATSVEGVGWPMLWSVKLHAESVMAMAVSRDNLLALTVSVDHLIGKYDLVTGANAVYRTKHPGNGSVAIRGDGKVCAIGGWDGSIRLYSTKSFKSLGTLDYHKGACQAITFANVLAGTRDTAEADNEDGMSVEEQEARSRWLIGGGKEGRVSIWKLMDFEGKKR